MSGAAGSDEVGTDTPTAGAPAAGAANGGSENGGGGGGQLSGGAGAGGSLSGAGGGSAGAAPTCNACANGFACSTATCKTTCSADADCLSDHFCSSGQCRLDAVQVSVGSSHACVLLADKTASCWGKNDRGQLGNASPSQSTTPVQVKFLSGAQAIAAGDGMSLALLSDGTVVFWGTRFTAYSNGYYTSIVYQYPTQLDGLATVKQITAGGRGNGCATLVDGSARCWGINDWGQLGNGTGDFSAGPVVVSGINGGVSTAFAYSSACAQIPSGVACWGDNLSGNLGSYSSSLSNTPQTIAGLTGTVWKLRVADGLGCVLMTNGSIQCWGSKSGGQGGNPVTVPAIPGALDLAIGPGTCALLTDGTVRCWGYGSVTTPTAVQGVSDAVAVGAGGSTACVILSNGSVKCWGRVIGEDSTDYASPTTVW